MIKAEMLKTKVEKNHKKYKIQKRVLRTVKEEVQPKNKNNCNHPKSNNLLNPLKNNVINRNSR